MPCGNGETENPAKSTQDFLFHHFHKASIKQSRVRGLRENIFPRFLIKRTFATCRAKVIGFPVIFTRKVSRGNLDHHTADEVEGFSWWLVIGGGRGASVRCERIET